MGGVCARTLTAEKEGGKRQEDSRGGVQAGNSNKGGNSKISKRKEIKDGQKGVRAATRVISHASPVN